MSRKNFKVATASNGKTPTQDKKHTFVIAKKDNTPIGKIKTLEDKEKIRKEREEQYRTFRINALKRRAKRMGLSEEQTKIKVNELLNQLDTPNSYNVLFMFNRENKDMIKEVFNNEGLVCNILTDEYGWIEADQETLGTLREILPQGTKIHPYVKKKPPILNITPAKKDKKPTNNKKGTTKRVIKHWKCPNTAGMSKKKRSEFKAQVKTLKDHWKAKKKQSGTVVQLKPKKGSTASKKASTLKKAA